MRACHIVRPGTEPSERHPVAGDFATAAALLGLPKA
jgi:hypothetical protein